MKNIERTHGDFQNWAVSKIGCRVERETTGFYRFGMAAKLWEAWAHQQEKIDVLEDKLAAVRSSSSVCDRIDQLTAMLDEVADRLGLPKDFYNREHDIRFWLDSPPAEQSALAVPADSAAGIMSPMNACMHRDACRAMLQSTKKAPDAHHVIRSLPQSSVSTTACDDQLIAIDD